MVIEQGSLMGRVFIMGSVKLLGTCVVGKDVGFTRVHRQGGACSWSFKTEPSVV